MASNEEQTPEKIQTVWTKIINPLRWLNTFEIERLLENARLGQDVKLQAIYALIEQQTPIFSVCMEKRCAGLANRLWDIVPIDGYEKDANARTQAFRIKQIFKRSDELSENSLTDAIRTLQQGAFRGRAYVKPFFKNGVLSWRRLENWNVLRAFNKNWWNPSGDFPCVSIVDRDSWFSNMVEIPSDEVCYTLYQNPIDLPGVMVYLRHIVGENKWAQMIERRGNPQVVLTPPDGTPESALGLWNQKAIQIQNGASGVIDAGSKVQQLEKGREDEPFSDYVRHQEEVICIMATGGTLNTLGGSTGLGSNLAEKQDEQFQSLINQDARKIANTINNVAIKKICDELGQKKLCRFQFVEQDETSADEYLELAKKAKELGATIDLTELKELTKLSFISLSQDDGQGDVETEAWSPS